MIFLCGSTMRDLIALSQSPGTERRYQADFGDRLRRGARCNGGSVKDGIFSTFEMIDIVGANLHRLDPAGMRNLPGSRQTPE